MTENECLSHMKHPGAYKPEKYGGGVIQIALTRGCDLACSNCTQGSNLKGKVTFMSPELFEQAVMSLRGFHGITGVFGGNPALHPQFETICNILAKHIPWEQRGLWCNNPMTLEKAQIMSRTFNHSVSNLNVHLDQDAYDLFKAGWPQCGPVGLHQDSRHSPCYVALRDLKEFQVPCPNCDGPWEKYSTGGQNNICRKCNGKGYIYDEQQGYELISKCPINQHWSASIGVFRGELRAWFCEIAMAQSILHQDDLSYPDTGIHIWPDRVRPLDQWGSDKVKEWWQLPMTAFKNQVSKHCHECSVPLNGYGELAQAKDGTEQVSALHQLVYKPKDTKRHVQLVTSREQLEEGKIESVVKYIQNASK